MKQQRQTNIEKLKKMTMYMMCCCCAMYHSAGIDTG